MSGSEDNWRTLEDRYLLSTYSKLPICIERGEGCWQIAIPQELQAEHEAHFREVMERYLQYLTKGRLPRWETDYMRAKYYITTKALELARQ